MLYTTYNQAIQLVLCHGALLFILPSQVYIMPYIFCRQYYRYFIWWILSFQLRRYLQTHSRTQCSSEQLSCNDDIWCRNKWRYDKTFLGGLSGGGFLESEYTVNLLKIEPFSSENKDTLPGSVIIPVSSMHVMPIAYKILQATTEKKETV